MKLMAVVYVGLSATLRAAPELSLPSQANPISKPVLARLENRQFKAWDLTLYDPSTKQSKVLFSFEQRPVLGDSFWDRDWKALYLLIGQTMYRAPWQSGVKLERYFDLPKERSFPTYTDFEHLWLDRDSNQWRFVETFTECGTTSDPKARRFEGNFYELSRDLKRWKLIEKQQEMCCDIPNACGKLHRNIRDRIKKEVVHPLSFSDHGLDLINQMRNSLKNYKAKSPKTLKVHLVSAAAPDSLIEITLVEREAATEACGESGDDTSEICEEYEPHFAPPVTWILKSSGRRNEVSPKGAQGTADQSKDVEVDWYDHWLTLTSASSTRFVDLRTGEVVLEISKGYADAQQWVTPPSENSVKK